METNNGCLSTADLEEAAEYGLRCLLLVLDDKIDEKRDEIKTKMDLSFYHSHAYSVLMSFDAGTSLDKEPLEKAIEALTKTIESCNRHRRTKKRNASKHFDSYTDVEIHAELCFAEASFLKLVLSFLLDENWINFVKSSLKIKAFYNAYRECYIILKKKTALQQNGGTLSKLDRHFFSGVYFGVGSFYMVMSLLPTKVVKLIKIFGVNATIDTALAEFEKGRLLENSVRGQLCGIGVLVYQLLLHYLVDVTHCDFQYVDEIMKGLDHYPNGFIKMIFTARLEFVRGDLNKSISLFEKAVHSKKGWKQLHYVCFWYEATGCILLGDWRRGRELAGHLFDDNRWTKATCAYLKAAFMLMEKPTLSTEEMEEVKELMIGIRLWKRKIAGRLPPIEKFVSVKSKRFFDNEDLLLPLIELIYLWNALNMRINDPKPLEMFLSHAEDAEKRLKGKESVNKLYYDDMVLVLLIKASCLRHLGRLIEARTILQGVCDMEKKIKKDKYLAPYAQLELGLTYSDLGNRDEAVQVLQRANKKYKGFLLENRLQKRVCSALRDIKQKINSCDEIEEAEEVFDESDVLPEISSDEVLGTDPLEE